MLKNATYKEKYHLLNPWISKILDVVKKDLKQEHLTRDREFAKKHFQGKNLQKLTAEEMAPAYVDLLIQTGAEEWGEYVATRWLLKNTEIYEFFESRLAPLYPNLSEVEELRREDAAPLLDQAVEQYGPLKTYIFSVLNSVVFPSDLYEKLRRRVIDTQAQHEKEVVAYQEEKNLEALKASHQQELARTIDKYEKKLAGLQRKYVQDVESLKKQIGLLHKKIASMNPSHTAL